MSFSPLDLFFPKRCVACKKFGAYFCKTCLNKVEFVQNPICPICQKQAIGGKTHPVCQTKYGLDGLAAGCFYKGPIRLAVKKVKYRFVHDIAAELCDLLVSNLWRFNLPDNVILVPVPLHWQRKNWRGFNQAELIAKKLNKNFKVAVWDIILRTKNTKPQVELGRKERLKNVAGAFALGPSSHTLSGRNLLLVDDVYTSGATMKECAKILKRAHAKSVWAMTLALG